MNNLLPIFVVVPLVAAFLVMILGKFIRNLHKYLTCASMFALLVLAVYAFIYRGDQSLVYIMGGWKPAGDFPIAIYLILDGFSVIMISVISLIGFIAACYSISYISRYTAENHYYALFCLIVAGMNGVVLSGDLFNLFVFLELSVMASYALVAFGVGKEELEASFKYQVLGGLASFLILLSISLIYWKTKTLNIADIREVLKAGYSKTFYIFIQVLLLSGFGLKAAIVPFHAWLPDAHSSAPSPISAMLSGVLIKAAGVYVIIRLFFNMFEITEEISIVITTLGTVSMVLGVLLAIGQWDIKRLLAYHSISQMGYVIFSVGIGMIIISRDKSPEIAALAIGGGLYHLINHAVFKGLLFLNAGSIEYVIGTRNLKEMGGLSASMPFTSSSSFIASMSISGIPPFNGFFSKLIIIIAAVEGKFYFLAFLAVLVSIVTLASFLKFQRYAFSDSSAGKKHGNISEVPFPMVLSMVLLGLLCLALSVLGFPAIRDVMLGPAIENLTDIDAYSFMVTGF